MPSEMTDDERDLINRVITIAYELTGESVTETLALLAASLSTASIVANVSRADYGAAAKQVYGIIAADKKSNPDCYPALRHFANTYIN